MNYTFENFYLDNNGSNDLLYVNIDDEDNFFEIVEDSLGGNYIFIYLERCERRHIHVSNNLEELVYDYIPKFLKENA